MIYKRQGKEGKEGKEKKRIHLYKHSLPDKQNGHMSRKYSFSVLKIIKAVHKIIFQQCLLVRTQDQQT